METIHDLHLEQSLHINNDLRLAIDMLAMTSEEVDELCAKEIEENPFIFYAENSSKEASAFSFREASHQKVKDFREHLLEQLRFHSFNSVEKYIAEYLIHSLDDDGLLTDASEVFEHIYEESGIFSEWSESVRLRLLAFDPLGCGALSVKEALFFQASLLPKAKEICFLLKQLDGKTIQEFSKMELKKMIENCDSSCMKSLEPRPARAFRQSQILYSIPDLLLDQRPGPISLHLIKKNSDNYVFDSNAFLKYSEFGLTKNIKIYQYRARFLFKAMRFREHNLLLVARAIVAHQKGWFFENKALKPLSLKNIAEETGLHESSVSRLVKNKELLSGRGLHLLKYFFTQGPAQNNSEHASSASIKAQMSELIARENKQHPYSDQALKNILEANTVRVARRTVAKYREALGILSAKERKYFNVLRSAKDG